MLWFSIPAVILLASIPVLVIVSQTEDFNMRKYFENGQWAVYFQFSWALVESFYNPFSGFWFGAVFCFLVTSFCIMDAKGEW